MPEWSEIAMIVQALAMVYVATMQFINSRHIAEIKHATNSLTDRLVESTRIEATATGMAAGIQKQKDESKP